MTKWHPVDEAPLGQTVMLWQRAWRSPFPGKRIGDFGKVWLDTPTPEHGGVTAYAEQFAYIDAPTEGVERPSWARKGYVASGEAIN